jgi:cation transport ATPase
MRRDRRRAGQPPGSALADPIKESIEGAILELHAQGLRVFMATGGNRPITEALAG